MLVHPASSFTLVSLLAGVLFASMLKDAAAEQPAPTPDAIAEIGNAVSELDAAQIIEIIVEFPESVIQSERYRPLLIAAWVLSHANGDTASLEAVTEIAKTDPWSKGIIRQFGDAASNLKARPVIVSAEVVDVDNLSWAKQFRRDLLTSAVAGRLAQIQKLQDELENTPNPSKLRDELLRVSKACASIASVFQGSITSLAFNLSNAVKSKQHVEQRRGDRALSELRSTPDREISSLVQNRSGGANAYSVMQAREQQRASLVEAYSKLYDSYSQGQLRRIECMKKMQEVQAGNLDLKEKRAVLIWTLRKRKAENEKAKKEKRIASNLAKSQAQKQRTSMDVSVSWPSLFQHRDLRKSADALLKDMSNHSPSNSGALSVCYAKCMEHIRDLHQILKTDLDQLDSRQRAGLRIYLREIEEELQMPYQASGTIARINTAHGATKASNTKTSPQGITLAAGLSESISISLGGDDKELASFGLYRSIAAALVQAGQAEDTGALRELAGSIKTSKLLTAEHKAALNALGSRAYHGKVSSNDRALVEPTQSMLARIANVDSVSLDSEIQVEKTARDEAFAILLASMIPSEGSENAADPNP